MDSSHETGGGAAHQHGPQSKDSSCPECLASPNKPGSAKIAWAIAGIAVLLLLGVLFLGIGSAGGNLLSLGALPLAALLLCPLMMGAMMLMMGKHH